MKMIIAIVAGIAVIGGAVLALANEFGKFCEDVNPYTQNEERSKENDKASL